METLNATSPNLDGPPFTVLVDGKKEPELLTTPEGGVELKVPVNATIEIVPNAVSSPFLVLDVISELVGATSVTVTLLDEDDKPIGDTPTTFVSIKQKLRKHI